MRFLKVTVLFDLVALALMLRQVWFFATQYQQISLTSDKVQGWLMIVLFLLIISEIAIIFVKPKIGMIIYYIQFPIRLYLWVFTLGFITFIPEMFNLTDDKWFSVFLKLCFLTEVIRLYFTIKIHLKLN